MNNINNRQLITLGGILLVLVGLPLVITLSQRQQDNRSRATASTSLYLTPSSSATTPQSKNVGDTVTFDVMVNPGTNLVSLAKLEILYDSTKLQDSGANTFVVNSSAFPKTLEGPVISNGSILLSLSIGSDSTKAIQTVTKVGTLTFTAIAPTSTAATVSFSNKSQILSLAAGDQSTENVLSTTTPGYLSIAAPTTQVSPTTIASQTPTVSATTFPTATLIPTGLSTITPSPTASEPTIALTGSPTQIVSPTTIPSTPTTTLSFTVFMHGVGNSGDNVNPNEFSLSNKVPKHPTRTMQVLVYNVSNQVVASGPATITYASESGNFKGTINLANNLSAGLHTVKVQAPTQLRRLISGIQTITPLQNNVMPAATLIAGDVNSDNAINILDYNLLVGCYSDLLPPVSCTETTKVLSDLNDDGFVNQFDYNMFLREISVQAGS
jgi:hypothetical protein